MRIALVITELNPGGAERCLTELAIHLSRRGHQVLVLALGTLPRSPYDDLLLRLTEAGIDVRSGDARGSLSLWRVLGWLRKQLDAFAPDVVQAMLWHANVLSACALRGRNAILIGGMRVSEPRRWRWTVERWATRRMAYMVCVSDDVRQHAFGKEGLPADKLVVIPNGVRLDPSPAPPQRRWTELGVDSAEHVLLFVGRLEPQKGPLELAEHASRLLAALDDWTLVFMGKGSLQAQLESAIHNRAISKRVALVGWRASASSWIASSDIVLLPARYEGMPNVLLEAMAAGKPFVAFSVDGVEELLAGDYPAELAEAQLATPGDWDGFVERAQALALHGELRQACSEANLRQAAARFRLEDQLAKYETLYEQLMYRGEGLAPRHKHSQL